MAPLYMKMFLFLFPFIWGMIKIELEYFAKDTLYYILYLYENSYDIYVYVL